LLTDWKKKDLTKAEGRSYPKKETNLERKKTSSIRVREEERHFPVQQK